MEQQLLLQIPAEAEEAPAESSFLPGTNIQYIWSASSLEDLKRCPRLYYYNKIECWEAEEESVHLRFGHELHQSLHDYEVSRAIDIPHDDALHDVVRELVLQTIDWKPSPSNARQEKAMKYKNRDTLIRTVIWYLDKYKDDPAQTFIMSDGKAAVELPFRFELDWGPKAGAEKGYDWINANGKLEKIIFPSQPYILHGILDRVVTFNDDLYVMDHKTTTSTPSDYYFDQFEPNNQMSLYTLASQVVFQSPIRGVIINACQVAIGFSETKRSFTYRTKDQIEEWVNDLHFWFARAEEYATAGYWPMNDTACDKFGGCKFRQICSKSPQVREQFLKSNFVRGERWNPLKPR